MRDAVCLTLENKDTMHLIFPETRNSLILRLSDSRDVDAWDQFVAIYEPLVYRLARIRGFQDSDARDITQEVFLSVSRAVERWEPDPKRGRFRDWLFLIARNDMLKILTRRKHRPLGSGDSRVNQLLKNQTEAEPEANLEQVDLEYQREVFRWAGEQVRHSIREKTWLAFTKSSIDGTPIEIVAEQLGMTQGAIHIARCRVIRKLREKVKEIPSTETDRTKVKKEDRGGQ